MSSSPFGWKTAMRRDKSPEYRRFKVGSHGTEVCVSLCRTKSPQCSKDPDTGFLLPWRLLHHRLNCFVPRGYKALPRYAEELENCYVCLEGTHSPGMMRYCCKVEKISSWSVVLFHLDSSRHKACDATRRQFLELSSPTIRKWEGPRTSKNTIFPAGAADTRPRLFPTQPFKGLPSSPHAVPATKA